MDSPLDDRHGVRIHRLGEVRTPRNLKDTRSRENPVVAAMLKGLTWRELQNYGPETTDLEERQQQELLDHLGKLDGVATEGVDGSSHTHTAREEREKLVLKYSKLSDMFVDGVLDDVVAGVQAIPGLTADERQGIVSSFIAQVIRPYEKWLTSSKRRAENNGFGDPRRSPGYNRELDKRMKQRINQVRRAIMIKYEKMLRRLDKRGIFSKETNKIRADAMLKVELRRRLDIEAMRRDIMKQLDEVGAGKIYDAHSTSQPFRYEERNDPAITRHRNMTESIRRRSINIDPVALGLGASAKKSSGTTGRPAHVRFAIEFEGSEASDDVITNGNDSDSEEGEVVIHHGRRRSDDPVVVIDDPVERSDSQTSGTSATSVGSAGTSTSASSVKSLDRWESLTKTNVGGASGRGMRRWKSVGDMLKVRRGRGRGKHGEGEGEGKIKHHDSIASIISQLTEALSEDPATVDNIIGGTGAGGDGQPERPQSDLWGTFGYRPFVTGRPSASSPVPEEVVAAEARLDEKEAKELELERKVESMRARMRDKKLKLVIASAPEHTQPSHQKTSEACTETDTDESKAEPKSKYRHRYVPGRGDVDDLVAEYPPLPEVEKIVSQREKHTDNNVNINANAVDVPMTENVNGMRSHAVRIASHSGELTPGRHYGFGLGPLPPPEIPVDVRLAQDLVHTPAHVLEGSVAWNPESMKFRRPRKRIPQRRQLLTRDRVEALFDSVLAGVIPVPVEPIDDPDLEGYVAPKKEFIRQLKDSEPAITLAPEWFNNRGVGGVGGAAATDLDTVTKEDKEENPALVDFHKFTQARQAHVELKLKDPKSKRVPHAAATSTGASTDTSKETFSFSLHHGLLSGAPYNAHMNDTVNEVMLLSPWSSSSMLRLTHYEPWKHIAPQCSRPLEVSFLNSHSDPAIATGLRGGSENERENSASSSSGVGVSSSSLGVGVGINRASASVRRGVSVRASVDWEINPRGRYSGTGNGRDHRSFLQ